MAGNKAHGLNNGLAIWRLKCYNWTFMQGSTVVILLSFCAKFPPHRQAEKRYRQFKNDTIIDVDDLQLKLKQGK